MGLDGGRCGLKGKRECIGDKIFCHATKIEIIIIKYEH